MEIPNLKSKFKYKYLEMKLMIKIKDNNNIIKINILKVVIFF